VVVPGAFSKGLGEDEDVNEYYDDLATFTEKMTQLAQLIKEAKHVVVYTGAGISTSADIPDYRGPNGAWTNQDKGIYKAPEKTLEEVVPTYAHMALTVLQKLGLVHFVISTNLDNLHIRSGFPQDALSEMHGNCFKEICSKCGKIYLRDISVGSTFDHITGSKCDKPCRGKLLDTIVNFGEAISPIEWERSVHHSEKADLTIVLGTSMRVLPACILPELTLKKNNGKMVICNFQITPYDQAGLKFHCSTDDFMFLLMQQLEIAVPFVTPEGIPLRAKTELSAPASHMLTSNDKKQEYYNAKFKLMV